jgi:hypothetical protein
VILPNASTGFYNSLQNAPFVFLTVEGNFWATGTFHVQSTDADTDPAHPFQNAGILARDPNGENWVAVEIGRQASGLGYLFKSTRCLVTDSNTQHAGWRNGELFLCRDGSAFVAYVRPEGCPTWVVVAPPIPDTGFPPLMQVGVMASAYDNIANNRTLINHFEIRPLENGSTCQALLPP